MITERDLKEAIAECEGVPKPTANTCIKLAAFYTIQEHLFGKVEETAAQMPMTDYSGHSYLNSQTEFAEAVKGMDPESLMPIIDELMETLQIVQPRLYSSVLRKLKE